MPKHHDGLFFVPMADQRDEEAGICLPAELQEMPAPAEARFSTIAGAPANLVALRHVA